MNATKTHRPSRKAILDARAHTFGKEAGFVSNVILNWARNPTRKLAGLVKLLERGHNVRTAQFTLDILLVDGQRYDWTALETVK